MDTVSDEGLDNARQEVQFRFKQLTEMAPSAKAISDNKLANITADNLLQNAIWVIQDADLKEQFRDLLCRIIEAQAKYIQLLEKRIGK